MTSYFCINARVMPRLKSPELVSNDLRKHSFYGKMLENLLTPYFYSMGNNELREKSIYDKQFLKEELSSRFRAQLVYKVMN